MRGADALVEMLILHGVKYVFGVPGDTSMAWHDALRLRAKDIQYIICRDERSAAYAADSYARMTGSLGVFDVPSGGGALYAVPGLSEANNSNFPLLCIASEINISSEETNALTDCNQEILFSAVTKWNYKLKTTAAIPFMVRKAIRESCVGAGGATALSIPENILRDEYGGRPEDLYAALDVNHYQQQFRSAPPPNEVEALIRLIDQAEKPLVIAGGGVHLSYAQQELTEFAANYAIPVASSIEGKGSVCEYWPYALGAIGTNGGSLEANDTVAQADLLIVLGCKMDNVTTAGKKLIHPQAKIVQVDICSSVLCNNIRVDLPIFADIKMLLAALNQAFRAEHDYSGRHAAWLAYAKSRAEAKYARIEQENHREAEQVISSRVFAAFDKYTGPDTIHVGDAGTPTPYIAAHMRAKQAAKKVIIPRSHGALGYAIGASIGAQIACPDCRVIAYFGDASFAMSLGDLETIKRLQLPIVLVNFQNDCYGWIKSIQRLYYQDNYFGVDFSPIDAVKIAEGFEIIGRHVSKNAEIEEAVQWALAQNRPVLLNFVVEPVSDYVPPVPQWEIDINKPADQRKKTVY